jgi:hypothetical protein
MTSRWESLRQKTLSDPARKKRYERLKRRIIARRQPAAKV